MTSAGYSRTGLAVRAAAGVNEPAIRKWQLSGLATHYCLLAAYTAVYLAVVLPTASARLLWNDELFSLVVSNRSFHEIWRLLVSAADQLPPAFYVITHAALTLSGPLEMRMRVPEIFGFWLMGVCLFEFAAYRTSLLHGAIAALLPCLTAAFQYAFEARPYGLVAGFAALALLFWQRANEEAQRKFALAGFSLALMAAASVHYYAIFLLCPFGAGEAVRWRRGGRFRASMWLAIGSGILPVAIAAPLLRTAGQVAHAFWARAEWVSIPVAYGDLLGDSFLAAILLAGAALFFWQLFRRAPHTGSVDGSWAPPLPEIVAVAVFAFMPIIVVPIAKMTTHAFTSRYVIATLPGICILLAWALYAVTARRPVLTTLLTLAMFASVAIHGGRLDRGLGAERKESDSLSRYLGIAQPGSIPLVIGNPHLFFELSHYASPQLAKRIVYLADTKLAIRHTGADTPDAGMIALGPVVGARVPPFEQFLKSTPQFLVFGNPGGWDWVVSELVTRKCAMEVVGRYGDEFLFLVRPGPQA